MIRDVFKVFHGKEQLLTMLSRFFSTKIYHHMPDMMYVSTSARAHVALQCSWSASGPTLVERLAAMLGLSSTFSVKLLI